jgi:cytochrome P450
MSEQLDPVISFADPGTARCPFHAYEQLQARQPVYLDPKTGLYEVTGGAEIRHAASDPVTFSNKVNRQSRQPVELQAQLKQMYAEEGIAMTPTLLNNDGQDHQRYRALVNKAFSPTGIRELMPSIRAEVDRLLDECAHLDEFDFVQRFAIPLPLNIIADQFGVPRSEHTVVKTGSDAMMAVADPTASSEQMIAAVRSIIRMQKMLVDRIEHVRQHPDNTILGLVANTATGDGAPMTTAMLVNLFQNILVAGNETTTNALGNALMLLIEQPALAERLRQAPDQVKNFVEESLRVGAPLQGFYRVATCDTELGGVQIPAGAVLMLRWGAASRDPQLYPCPAQVELDRKAINQHMTFGHGVHYCIGHLLARAELRAAFEAILSRWSSFRLSTKTADPVAPVNSFLVYGSQRMRIEVQRS